MAGLLDQFDPNTPQGLAYAQMAQGLLGGGSNAQRFAGAAATYAQEMQRERARKLIEDERRQLMEARAQEMQQRQRQQQEAAQAQAKAAQDEAIARRLFGAQQQMGMPTGQMGPEMPERTGGMINPQTFLQQGGSLGGLGGVSALNQLLAPKERKPIISKPGDIARDPVTGAEVWKNEREPEKIDPNKPFMIGPDGRPVPNPEYQAYAERVAAAGAARGGTVVMPPQEKAEARKVGEYFGDQYADIQKSGIAAGQTINRLGQMRNMLQGMETGKLTPLATEVAGYARAFGINIDPKLEAKEAVDAISKEMALQMRNPSGGAGMPGALSDKDREFLEKIVPGLSKTPGGNAMIIEARMRLAKRDQVVAKLARDYRAKKGTLDEGFYEELQQYADANPLYDDLAPAAANVGGTDLGGGFKLKGN